MQQFIFDLIKLIEMLVKTKGLTNLPDKKSKLSSIYDIEQKINIDGVDSSFSNVIRDYSVLFKKSEKLSWIDDHLLHLINLFRRDELITIRNFHLHLDQCFIQKLKKMSDLTSMKTLIKNMEKHRLTYDYETRQKRKSNHKLEKAKEKYEIRREEVKISMNNFLEKSKEIISYFNNFYEIMQSYHLSMHHIYLGLNIDMDYRYLK